MLFREGQRSSQEGRPAPFQDRRQSMPSKFNNHVCLVYDDEILPLAQRQNYLGHPP